MRGGPMDRHYADDPQIGQQQAIHRQQLGPARRSAQRVGRLHGYSHPAVLYHW